MDEIKETIDRAISEVAAAGVSQEWRDAIIHHLGAMKSTENNWEAFLAHFHGAMRTVVDVSPIPNIPALNALANAIQAAKRAQRRKSRNHPNSM